MVALTCVPSQLYDHVYTFLLENNLSKTAKYLKKETGNSALKIVTGISLVEIFAKHYGSADNATDQSGQLTDDSVFLHADPEAAKSKSRKRKAQADDKPVKPKKLKRDKKKAYTLPQDESASDQVSATPEATPANAAVKAVEEQQVEPEKKKKKKKSKKSKQENGEAPILVAARSLKSPDAAVPEVVVAAPEVVATQEEAPSSQEATVPVVAQAEPEKKKKKKKKNKEKIQDSAPPAADSTAAATEDSAPAEEAAPAATQDEVEPDTVVTATAEVAKEQPRETPKMARKQYQHPQKNTPFRRVVEEDIFVPGALQDNSFSGKRNSAGDWGAKASQDLIVTRGKAFRHEKTKKKRGSYKGGQINMSVSSIKYPSDDE